MRDVKTRQGFKFWDKLMALPRFNFLLAKNGQSVQKWQNDSGDWIEQHSAARVMDEAQDRINELEEQHQKDVFALDKLSQLETDLARLQSIAAERDAGLVREAELKEQRNRSARLAIAKNQLSKQRLVETETLKQQLSLVEGMTRETIARLEDSRFPGIDLMCRLREFATTGVVAPGKYDDVLRPFMVLMERELHANAVKGDRPAWLKMSAGECLLEIYYHVAKLQKALRDNDMNRVAENTADVANLCLMMADICGWLDLIRKEKGL